MKVSWRIARISGIDICIDASWLIIFGLFTWIMASYYFPSGYPNWPRWEYWVVGAVTSILFFGSVLGHELAHSLVVISQGEKVRRITLFILGGVAQLAAKNVHQIPVVKEGRIQGIICRTDIVQFMQLRTELGV